MKSTSSTLVTCHPEALAMKEKIELLFAMQELADNKLSKDHDHDIASRIIDSARIGLRKANFLNIAETNDFCSHTTSLQDSS